MSPKYNIAANKHRIPDFIMEKLEEELEISSLANITESALNKYCDIINKKLFSLYEEKENDLSGFIDPDIRKGNKTIEFFSVKSLYRYISGQNIRTDKYRALLVFLNYDRSQINNIISYKNSPEQYSQMTLLNGLWNLYIYDSAEPSEHKVTKYPMSMFYRKDNLFKIRLDNFWGKNFEGNAIITEKSLAFELQNDQEKLYLCTDLPEMQNKNMADDLILNCAYLSNAHRNTCFGNLIMTKVPNIDSTDETEVARHFAKEISRLSFYNDYNEKDVIVAVKNEKPIINFLSEGNHKDNFVKPFFPNSFESIRIENDEVDKTEGLHDYDKLKLKFNLKSHAFYSFNRSRLSHDEVAVFKYVFTFSDAERRCTVKRYNLGQNFKPEFTGQLYLQGEKIYMELTGSSMQRRKQLIAPFDSYPEKNHYDISKSLRAFILKGITSSVSVSDSRHMALRELIVCIKSGNEELLNFSETEKTQQFISYRTFCHINKDIISDEEKLFLANHAFSTLSFPSETDARFLHGGQDKARRYHGNYLVLIKRPHSNSLLKMNLEIDEMAQAWLRIKYDNDKNSEIYSYHGFCEYYNNNLHVSGHLSASHPNDQKHAEFIFDYIKETTGKAPFLFTGETINTDDENKSFHSRFLAINTLLLQKVNPSFNTQVGILNNHEMNDLQMMLKKELPIDSLDKYF